MFLDFSVKLYRYVLGANIRKNVINHTSRFVNALLTSYECRNSEIKDNGIVFTFNTVQIKNRLTMFI